MSPPVLSTFKQAFFVPLLAALMVFGPMAQLSAAERQKLEIVGPGGSHRFEIELARRPEELAQGLMYRRNMAADAGMLFDFGRVGPVSMWMKNTYLPLDMIFIRADGTIAHIAQRTVPQSLVVISSPEPILAVLEVNGGTAARLGIKAGDSVRHPLFAAK